MFEKHKVIVCVGSGGVGKTSVSAALAIKAAKQGLRTLVMTADPSRRLAQTLNLSEGFYEEHSVSIDDVLLYVSIPEVKTTFDRLVTQYAKHKERLLNNTLYQYFSTSLPGVHEFAVMESFYEAYSKKTYDLIILDTPPSQNVLDFLQAPQTILNFLNGNFQHFLRKLLVSKPMFGVASVSKVLGKLAGSEIVQQIAELLLEFESMYEGFETRAKEVLQLLKSEQTAFVWVMATGTRQEKLAEQTIPLLQQQNFHIKNIVLNRCIQKMPDISSLKTLTTEQAKQLTAVAQEQNIRAERGVLLLQQLRKMFSATTLWALPELPTDICDIKSLLELVRVMNTR